jgi:hypothetical protein
VVEEQIEIEVLVAYGHALLVCDEGEVRPQLQQEPLQLSKHGGPLRRWRERLPLSLGISWMEKRAGSSPLIH